MASIEDGSVSEVDRLDVSQVGDAIEIPGRPKDVGVGEGSVWVITNYDGNLYGTVTRIDPSQLP